MNETDEPLIVTVIRSYFPDWTPPKDTYKPWIKTLCPWHGESVASASISFEKNAFRCHACGKTGDAIALIRQQEGVSYSEANRIAEKISPGSNRAVPPKSAGVSSRRVFGEPKSGVSQSGSGRNRSVPPWLRE